MIQKVAVPWGKLDDELVRLSITGKVDDILQCKTPIDLEKIFTECGSDRKFVLIEGAPGSGKSTLALHICQEWAEMKLFHEFDFIILVKLRDPSIRKAKTVADLLPRVDKEMANVAETEIKAQFGRGTLWVLDGWDELPSDLPSDSIINKLIQPDMFQESPLHQCAVILTSRPSLSAELHPLVSSRVEVLGFTPHELEQYFRECLKGDSGAVQTLLERIRENPVVEGSCYLPLNAAIVAHVFLSGDHSLPTSNHGIFTAVVQSSLKRYLQDKLSKSIRVGDITSPDSLSPEIQAPVSHLCQLAFYGIQSNKLTFSDSDLAALSISKDVSELGLLQSVPSVVSDGHQIYFCFLHISIQELLAAVHISHMSPKRQISVFQELFGTPRFSAVFQFYAGITKLRTSRSLLSKLPRFLCPVPASVYDLIREIVIKERYKGMGKSKPLLISLFHCLYEAEDLSLCVFVANLLPHYLFLSHITLKPLDCLSIGYFLSVISTTINNEFRVILHGCSIGDQGCKFLVRGLCKYLNTQSYKNTPELVLCISCNDIHEDGIHHIAKLLKNTSVVRKLILFQNPIGEGGLKNLCEALNTNTTLEELNLGNCLLNIGEENGLLLRQLLNNNSSLNCLGLSDNKVTDCCHIAAGLSNNKALRKLFLRRCGLTDKCLEDLFTGLNNSIEYLNIRGNESVTEKGLKVFARHLTTLSGLRNLKIPAHLQLEPSINTVFSEVNEERRRIGLPEIKVAGECSYKVPT